MDRHANQNSFEQINYFHLGKYSVCKLVLNSTNGSYAGYSIASNRKTAKAKALGEAIERLALNTNKSSLSSNGHASHPELKKAKLNAALELIERDSFLFHYLTQIPMQKIIFNQSISIPKGIKKKHVGMARMAAPPGYKAFLGWIRLDSGKLFFGTSCGENSQSNKALQTKAFLEALLLFISTNHLPALSLKKFQSKKYKTPLDNRDIGRNLKIGNQFHDQFLTSIKKVPLSLAKKPKITFKKLSLKNTPYNHFRISVIQAKSPDLQDLFWGNTSSEKLNWKRFKNYPVNIKDIRYPHFYP